MKRLAAVLPLFLLAVTQASVAQIEIVIDVSEREAQKILQSYAPDELRYADLSWESNGRIRLAKINTAALKQSGHHIQFTPFPDVAPIVLISHGLTGKNSRVWIGEYVYNRINTYEEDPRIAKWIAEELPDEIGGPETDSLLKEMHDINIVRFGIGEYLKDPRTGEFLLDPDDPRSDWQVINAQNGQFEHISIFETNYKYATETFGFPYACDTSINPTIDDQLEGGVVLGDAGAVFGFKDSLQQKDLDVRMPSLLTVGGDTMTVPCKPAGDVLDRIASLPESARGQYSRAYEFRHAKPLPSDVRRLESVHTAIANMPSELFGSALRDRHVYKIIPLARNPEYVMIFESVVERTQMMIDIPDPESFNKSEYGKKYNKRWEDKAQNRQRAQARITARNKNRGSSK